MLGVDALAEGALNDIPQPGMDAAAVTVEVKVNGWLTLSSPVTPWLTVSDIEVNHSFVQVAIRAQT